VCRQSVPRELNRSPHRHFDDTPDIAADMGGLERAALVLRIGPICAFHEALFVNTFWSTEGFLASAWPRIHGTPPRLGRDVRFRRIER